MEKEVSELDRKLEVKRKYLEQIRYALTKDSLDQRDLYSIVRNFFTDFLRLEYEFTYEELVQELNKIFIKPADKKGIDEFLIGLSESEYLEERDLEQQEIKDYLQKFLKIVESLITNIVIEQRKVTFIEKILRRKPQEKSDKDNASEASKAKIMGAINTENPAIGVVQPNIERKVQPSVQEAAAENMPVMPSFEDSSTDSKDSLIIPQSIPDAIPEASETDTENVAMENKLIKQNMFKGFNMDMPIEDNSTKSAEKENKKTEKTDIKDKRLKSRKQDTKAKEPSENVLLISNEDKNSLGRPEGMFEKSSGMIRRSDTLETEDATPEIIDINRLLEKSYLSISTGNLDHAKEGYLKALGLYHDLQYKDKIKLYFRIYDLYIKLKSL